MYIVKFYQHTQTFAYLFLFIKAAQVVQLFSNTDHLLVVFCNVLFQHLLQYFQALWHRFHSWCIQYIYIVVSLSRVHVRRTDKLASGAVGHPIEEYMQYVEEWYQQKQEQGMEGTQKRVYLATDDPTILKEATKKYPYRYITSAYK